MLQKKYLTLTNFTSAFAKYHRISSWTAAHLMPRAQSRVTVPFIPAKHTLQALDYILQPTTESKNTKTATGSVEIHSQLAVPTAATNMISAQNKSPVSIQESSGNLSFLSLPLELRTKVYKLNLDTTGIVQVGPHADGFRRDRPPPPPRVGVNLLRSCKQVYVEAVQYAYRNRWWKLGPTPESYYNHRDAGHPAFDDMNYFKLLDNRTLIEIQRLLISIPISQHGWAASAPVFLRTLDSMQNLRYIKVRIYFRGAGNDSRWPSDWHELEDLTTCPLLVGIMDQILCQIPKHVEIIWSAYMSQYGERCRFSATGLSAVRALAREKEYVKGRKCKPRELVGPSSTENS